MISQRIPWIFEQELSPAFQAWWWDEVFLHDRIIIVFDQKLEECSTWFWDKLIAINKKSFCVFRFEGGYEIPQGWQ